MTDNQNTPNKPLAEVINPALIGKLTHVSQATGYSLAGFLNRAAELWLDVEGPVYLAKGQQV